MPSSYNWGYIAERQSYSCRGLKDGRCLYPRGKALGGTSVINSMLHTTGPKEDFIHWKELGIDGWDYEKEVLPAFKKVENSNLKHFHKSEYHGTNGEVSVENNPYSTPIVDIMIDGMQSIGYKEIDYNSDEYNGFGRLQANAKNGTRHSAFEAFIRPVLKRNNLHIMINTRATKVLINPETKEAYGVEIYRKGCKLEVFAKREVIVSAGTFNSPQLLILSGIGSTEDLEKLKIPQIANLPVGKIMHDHASFYGAIITTNMTLKLMDSFSVFAVAPHIINFISGQGYLTIPSSVEGLAFMRIGNASTPIANQPNIEFLTSTVNPVADGGFGFKLIKNFGDELFDGWLNSLVDNPNYVITIGITLLHPKSVGFMEVVSSNFFDSPKLYSNILKEQEDVETILEAIKFLKKLLNSPPLRKIDAKLFDKPIPMCKSHPFDSDDYWRCAIRVFSLPVHHQVGTCKMGSRSDKTAVVDSKLKVIGVENLRVIDTSVIPSAASAHTNSYSYMIGERGVEFIKMDHKEEINGLT